MKLYPGMYIGSNFLKAGTASATDAKSAWTAAAVRAPFVRSSICTMDVPTPRIDLIAIEEQARAARSAWIGGMLKSAYIAVARKFGRGEQA